MAIDYVQDMPPAGGYAPVQFRRNLPARGPRPAYYLLAFLGVTAYGWYRYLGCRVELRELEREKTWARIGLMPLIAAEKDRELVRQRAIFREREQSIMKDSSTWNVDESIYETDLGKSLPPSFYPIYPQKNHSKKN